MDQWVTENTDEAGDCSTEKRIELVVKISDIEFCIYPLVHLLPLLIDQ
jgi:hypothetical protein